MFTFTTKTLREKWTDSAASEVRLRIRLKKIKKTKTVN